MNQEQRAELAVMTMHGTIWTYIARYAGKPIGFISMLALVRLLSQEDFGLAAYSLAIIAFLSPLSNLCLDLAIVYYKDEETANTAFWMALGFSLGLFALIWFLSSLLGGLFPDPRSVGITRALALTFPISALFIVHSSLIQKQLTFDRETPPALVGACAKGLVSVGLAVLGKGPWALVWGEIASLVMIAITYWVVSPWRPALRFNTWLGQRVFSYGGPMVISNLFATFMSNAQHFLMGNFLGPGALGIYNVAYRLPNYLVMDFSLAQSRVFFPLYVKYQGDLHAQGTAYIQTLRQLSFLVIPAGLGLALLAKQLVLVFLSEKWLETIPVVQVLAMYSLIYAYERLGNAMMRAQGRLKVFIGLMVLRAFMLLPALWWAVVVQGSIVMVAWVYVGISFISGMAGIALARRSLRIGWRELLEALRPAFICGWLMALAVILALEITYSAHPALQLSVACLAGASVYMLASWRLQREGVSTIHSALVMIWRRVPGLFSASRQFDR